MIAGGIIERLSPIDNPAPGSKKLRSLQAASAIAKPSLPCGNKVGCG